MVSSFSLPMQISVRSVTDIVSSVGDQIFKSCSSIQGVATFIAACITVFNLVIVTGKIMSGDKVGVWGLFKPFVLLFVIAWFNTFVLTPVDFITKAAVNGVSSVNEGLPEANAADILDCLNMFENYNSEKEKACKDSLGINSETVPTSTEELSEQGASDVSASVTNGSLDNALTKFRNEFSLLGGKAATTLKNTFKDVSGTASGTFVTMLVTAFSVAVPLVVEAYRCFSKIYLAVLAILGPFCFAFSLVPGIPSNPMSWVARYIEVSMWQPIVMIVWLVYNKMIEGCNLSRFSAFQTGPMNVLSAAELQSALLSTVFISIVTFILLKNVRSLASVVMNAGGMGSMSFGGSIAGGARRMLGV